MDEPRTRKITDVDTLRALAHPLRLRVLDAVALHGPLTATEVAERVGESPANCSWHLRQLARYGFVTEAGGGTGRQRPWRLVTEGHRWGEGAESPALAQAGDAALLALLDLEHRKLRDWLAVRRQQSPGWREVDFLHQFIGWYTAAELQDLKAELSTVLARHLNRLGDPAARPPGSRPVRLLAWAVPDVDGTTVAGGGDTEDAPIAGDTDAERNGDR